MLFIMLLECAALYDKSFIFTVSFDFYHTSCGRYNYYAHFMVRKLWTTELWVLPKVTLNECRPRSVEFQAPDPSCASLCLNAQFLVGIHQPSTKKQPASLKLY